MSVPFFAKSDGDWVCSTPALDGDRLYVGGKFDLAQSWTHKAQGYRSTPLVIDGIAYEHLKGQRRMAIEVETGREPWNSSFPAFS